MLSILSAIVMASALSFGSPVNYPLSLAGNYGEPRPNHFHGGIDVRTGNAVGKPVFSIADGYVSRITVGLSGFGNAVYVTHLGGYTSVYCHFDKFVPQLSAMVRKWQYKNENYIADVRLKPTDFPVSQGQFIAVSGNTGASTAPHLHLELHDTRTGDMLDPLDVLKQYVKDTTPPIAHSFMAYPLEGEGVFMGASHKQTYGFSSANLTREFTAWGKVGFGIWANDYMEDSFGRLGIRRTTLTVDGKVVFSSDVDRIPVRLNRYVNSWGDYKHFCRTGVWFMKSFAEPGNMLPVIHTDGNRGYVDFNEERVYRLVYTISDIFGNTRQYTFSVHGKKQPIQARRKSASPYIMKYDKVNILRIDGARLILLQDMLADDIELVPKRTSRPGKVSDSYTFFGSSYPLFGWAEISINLNRAVKEPSKLYISGSYGSVGFKKCVYENGWVTGKMRELGASYTVEYDDTPPVISPGTVSGSLLRFSIYDTGSGIKSFKGYVDGGFVLFEKLEKSNVIQCRLSDVPVKKTGGEHRLKLVVTDNCGNSAAYNTNFKY